jgi:hypothetical protein
MPSYGYFPGQGSDWFPDSRRPEQELIDARKARENAPSKVLGEMALVFGTSLAVVLLIDIAVLLVSVPVRMFHLG